MKTQPAPVVRLYHVAFLLASLAMGSSLSATTLLDDNFESYTAGTAPTSPWVAPSNVFVSSITNAQSAFGPTGDTQGMRLINQSSNSTPSASTSFDLSGQTSSTLLIQFDYMYVATGNPSITTGNPQFIMQNGSTSGIRIMMTDTNGYASVRQGSSFTELTGMTLTSGTWYRFTQAINLSNSTFSLTIENQSGGSVTATGLAFENNVTNATSILYNFNAANSSTLGQYFIDNVSVQTTSIPEPQTAALYMGAFGVVAAVWPRLRKHF